MMSSLNWRVDNPMEWVGQISDDEYADLASFYESCDSILVGATTFQEMREYWPSQCNGADPATPHGRMAVMMTEFRKIVVTRDAGLDVGGWNACERLVADSDEALSRQVGEIKAASGKNIHLAGGSSLAASMIGLGLVDRLRLHVHPVLSRGPGIFDRLSRDAKLTSNKVLSFSNGSSLLDYSIEGAAERREVTDFDDLRAKPATAA
jgi:dihydrofolate reductase